MRKMMTLLAASALLASCGVPKKDHEAVVEQLKERTAQYEQLAQEKADSEAAMQAEIQTLEERLAALEAREDSLQTRLDEANATISMYESKTGGLQKALRVTMEDIEALRKQRAAALKRLREYRDLAKRLASVVESGQLAVKVRNNKMVLEMPNAVLFDSGKTEVKPAGQEALKQVAEALKTVDEREFLVGGHTDNVPIKVSGFESNWELSTARAVEVLNLLETAGVEPQRLAAAGFGEFDPVAPNETEEQRAQNRRTEIILMPKIDELPELPDDLFDSSS